MSNILENSRGKVVRGIRNEGLRRIRLIFPDIIDINELITIARMIAPAALSVNALAAKAIYDVAKTEMDWAKDPARTQEELDNYDPINGPAWP